MGLLDRVAGLLAPRTEVQIVKDTAPAKAPARRADGWQNIYSGMGLQGRDASVATYYGLREPLQYQTLTWLYRQDWVCNRVANEMACDGTRAGFELISPDKADQCREMMGLWRTLDARSILEEGERWALVYGGAVGLVYTDDKPTNQFEPLASPLLPASYNKVVRVDIVQRQYAVPNIGLVTTDPASPNYGLPEFYNVTPLLTGGATMQVHWTRIIRFTGIPVEMQTAIANLSYGDPIYERAYNVVRNRGASMSATASIVERFVQGVLKVRGLDNALVSEQVDGILRRLRAFNLGLGTSGVALVDADAEDYSRLGQPVSGMEGLLHELRLELAASVAYPMSRLYGTQAGALASAEVDERRWESTIHARQLSNIVPALVRLTQILAQAKGAPDIGDDWEVVPNPIQPPNAKADAEVRKVQAEVDLQYIQAGVLEPVEVRTSRFGGTVYSTTTTLDPQITAAIEASQQTADDEMEQPEQVPEVEPTEVA